MQTRAFHTLSVVAEIGSFAEAAKRLNMTLSAVSMQMKMLETQLDVALFDRSFRPPRLTPLGRDVAKRAGDIVACEEQLIRICQPANELRGLMRGGFVYTASVRLLPGFLKAAEAGAPEAEFVVETGLSETLQQSVLDGDLDFAVLTATGPVKPGLDVAVLRKEELVYALPLPVADLDFEDILQSLPFFQFAPDTGIGRLIAAHIGGLPMQPARLQVLDGVESILECVKQGLGFTVLPAPDIARTAEGSVAVRPLEEAAPITRDLILLVRSGTLSSQQWHKLQDLFPAEH